jgi:hypothetical protein
LGTELEGYFLTAKHEQELLRLQQINSSGSHISTPYEFAKLALAKKYRKPIYLVIDLALLLPELSCLSAEELFIGCCLYIKEVQAPSLIDDQKIQQFHEALLQGIQVCHLLKQMVEELNE